MSESDISAKQKLIKILTTLLDSGTDLSFLVQLDVRCLEQLIVALRIRLENKA